MSTPAAMFRSPADRARVLAAYDRVLADWRVPVESRYVPTSFGDTHLLVSGPPTAPPLVLLPGNFASALMWQPNIAALSAAHRVYAIDVVGNVGRSAPDRPPRTRDDVGRWLVEVWEALRLAHADVAALSYGTFLSVALALHASARVQRLVWLSPDLGVTRPRLRGAVYGAAMLLTRSPRAVERYLRAASTRPYERGDPYLAFRILANSAVRTLHHRRPSVERTEWRRLTIPTLVLLGADELLYDPLRTQRALQRRLPDVQIEIVPEAGHAIHRDLPALVCRRILAFCRDAAVPERGRLTSR